MVNFTISLFTHPGSQAFQECKLWDSFNKGASSSVIQTWPVSVTQVNWSSAGSRIWKMTEQTVKQISKLS